jgi:H+/Cl- antiporter ClcA
MSTKTPSTAVLSTTGTAQTDAAKDVGIVLLTGALGGLAGAAFALIHNNTTRSSTGSTESVAQSALIGFIIGLVIALMSVLIYMAYNSAKRHAFVMQRENALQTLHTSNVIQQSTAGVSQVPPAQVVGGVTSVPVV